MRFAVARQNGLTETLVELIDDDYRSSALDDRTKAIVALTDCMLSATTPPDELCGSLRQHLTDPQLVELVLGVGLFHGFSKLMISLGLEPEAMATTVLPTPGS